MNPARALREARRRAGLTQAALAERARTSQATVSAYESGSKEPSIATFSRLLAATGSRLSVEPAAERVHVPTRAELARAGRTLAEVIELAEALPVRHARELHYPRLDRDAA
jgi:transcriptional regulator with XRE-family HTH domain